MTPIADPTAARPPHDAELENLEEDALNDAGVDSGAGGAEAEPVAGEADAEPVAGEADAEPVAGEVEAEPVAGELDAEPVDAVPVPVLAEVRTLAPTIGALPAVQAAAVAATGFVAGAATLALVRRHSARRLARARPVRGRAVDMLPIVGSRTFVVDVHLLAKPGE